jgi:hypothetical protein
VNAASAAPPEHRHAPLEEALRLGGELVGARRQAHHRVAVLGIPLF